MKTYLHKYKSRFLTNCISCLSNKLRVEGCISCVKLVCFETEIYITQTLNMISITTYQQLTHIINIYQCKIRSKMTYEMQM